MSDAREILQEARAALAVYGWRQGELGDCESGFCALGALVYADYKYRAVTASEPHIHSPAYWAAARILRDVAQYANIVSWNDRDDQTQDQVMRAFDFAIMEAEAQ